MNVSELYMTLEVYAHLRDLPQFSALRAEIEKSLKTENDALIPKSNAATLHPQMVTTNAGPNTGVVQEDGSVKQVETAPRPTAEVTKEPLTKLERDDEARRRASLTHDRELANPAVPAEPINRDRI